jgi:hypothetical protein
MLDDLAWDLREESNALQGLGGVVVHGSSVAWFALPPPASESNVFVRSRKRSWGSGTTSLRG